MLHVNSLQLFFLPGFETQVTENIDDLVSSFGLGKRQTQHVRNELLEQF